MSQNNPTTEELVKQYREAGMNPIFSEKPEKAKKFLESYTAIRSQFQYWNNAEEEQKTKADVDLFFDKTMRCRELAEEWLLPEKDSLTDKHIQDLKQEIEEMREKDEVEDLSDYFWKCVRLEGLFMADYMKNDLLMLGGGK